MHDDNSFVTKQDLREFERVVSARIRRETRVIVFALVAVVVSISSVALFR
jgi:hypothetical protein